MPLHIFVFPAYLHKPIYPSLPIGTNNLGILEPFAKKRKTQKGEKRDVRALK